MIVMCCLKAINCDTGIITWISIGPEGSPTYNTWNDQIGNNFTTTNTLLPGIWIIDSICCSGACGDYLTNCQVGAISIDIGTVTFGGTGCPAYSIELTNCQDGSTLYTTDIDANYIGSVVTIAEYPGCWQVGEADVASLDTVTFLNAFSDCTCCLGEAYPPKPTSVQALPYSATTPASPRLFYQVTQGECDINANIKFANGYYRLFQSLKNGYGNCCDSIDLDKLWIKKEQSDYSVMTDPNACTVATEVTPIICPEPS